MKKILRSAACLLLIGVAFVFFLSVSAQPTDRYDPSLEGILSDYYTVEQGWITGIAPGTPVSGLLSVCTPVGVTAEGETVVTGTQLSYGEDLRLTAVVRGDLNGDGAATVTDFLLQKAFLLGQELTPLQLAAGDLNGDGSLTVTDFLMLKSHLLGQEVIRASYTGGRLFLLEPGKSVSWQVAGASGYITDSAAPFTVDSAGTVTASGLEGTAFVYALAQDGSVLQRQLVTVLSQPLTLELGTERCRVTLGQSLTLTPSFNHPVDAAVTWSTSDPAVATVENGVITGVSFGEARVTAALENGFRAELSVTVAPPTTELRIERKLYKVKPGCSRQLALTVLPAESNEEVIWTTSDPAIATVAADGTVTGVAYGTVTVTATGRYSGLSASCSVKVCNVKQVALTFDDGPSPQTARLLDFLKEQDIRVTFFLVGSRISTYKNTVCREVNEGHEIAYHSYSHQNQTGLTTEKIKSDLKKSDQLLYELTGAHFTLWRTPGGNYNARVLEAVELPHIMWSRDTLDWKNRNAYSVYASVRNAKDGDIVLMHDLYGTTVDGAIMAMKEMLAGDYEFLTVTELLSRDGTPPENSVNYFNGR